MAKLEGVKVVNAEKNTSMQGERDYKAIEGDTGPIVYPAGHLYAYSILHWLSNHGSIGAAQIIFGTLYLINQVILQPACISRSGIPISGHMPLLKDHKSLAILH